MTATLSVPSPSGFSVRGVLRQAMAAVGLVLALATMASPVAAQEECQTTAQINQSTLKHLAAGSVIYIGSRVVGFPESISAGLGIGANLGKELYDVCGGSGFDFFDLGAGAVGVFATLLLDRAFTGGSDEPRVAVHVDPALDRPRLGLAFRIPF